MRAGWTHPRFEEAHDDLRAAWQLLSREGHCGPSNFLLADGPASVACNTFCPLSLSSPRPMNRFWSPLVEQLRPYIAGEQARLPDLIKLNTNESPYGPAPEVLDAIKAVTTDELRLYPDPQSMTLRRSIADHYGVAPDEVFVGNGSDEVLAIAFCALLNHGKPIFFPDITYSFYPVYCGLYGIPYRAIPVNERFEVEVGDYAGDCGGIVLANPNAPTGVALPLERIDALLAMHPDQVVVIDEAYVDFGAQVPLPCSVAMTTSSSYRPCPSHADSRDSVSAMPSAPRSSLARSFVSKTASTRTRSIG